MEKVKQHFIANDGEFLIRSAPVLKTRNGMVLIRNVNEIKITDIFITENKIFVNFEIASSMKFTISNYKNQEFSLENFKKLGILETKNSEEEFEIVKNKINNLIENCI